MLTGVTVRIRLLGLALLPLTMLVTVIAMAPANASRLDASFQDLFNNRMKPISQLKIVADALPSAWSTSCTSIVRGSSMKSACNRS
ncbi:putative chemotaxis transducer [Pseudomonas aeruginosa]|nr:hypothetical protein AN455_07925 [Pseudomonas aeruginosa]KRV15690.1 hypothetical protein AN456_07895 [Pseudomonas aeruginosa]SQC50019.1 putative chemotaxis transducer [Pseudomonas aeruginosa]